RTISALGKPVGVNAFGPKVAERYRAAGATFVLVGADVALLARGSEALAASFIPSPEQAESSPPRASY
ncbi:MAG: 2-dehydro-3-deoxyglucarate aldolase, partial [Mycetocola sp.]